MPVLRYHSHKVQPRFPFGHGLSYTSFVYGGMVLMQPPPPLCGGAEVFDVCVAFNVSNTGAHDGADVPQLYITYPAAAEEPPRQLRFFTKVQLLLNAAYWHRREEFIYVARVTCRRSCCALARRPK